MRSPFDQNNNYDEYNNKENGWKNPYIDSNDYSNSYQSNNNFHPNNSYQTDNNLNYEESPTSYYNPYSSYNNPVSPNTYKEKNKGLKKLLIAFAIITPMSIIGLCSFIIYNQFSENRNNPLSTFQMSSSTGINPNAKPTELHKLTGNEEGMNAQQIYQKLVKSTVGIILYDTASSIIPKQASQGTGIIISNDGYIVTNSHVIGDSKSSNVTVILGDDNELSATVVGFDKRTDLAVLKIDATDLTPVEFGDSDQVSVGSWVLAIGNPGGIDFANSLTRGIVSAVNRPLGASNLVTYIQTDAAINPGNSGGALIDMYGRVIGINSAKISATGYEGMGFSVPTKIAKTVIDDIIKQGYVSGRADLGAKCDEISPYVSQMYSVPQGVIIKDILKDSDLINNGVKIGDVITKVNGTSVSTVNSLLNELAAHKPGDQVTLTIYRANSRSRFYNQSSTFDAIVTLIEDKGEIQVSPPKPKEQEQEQEQGIF